MKNNKIKNKNQKEMYEWMVKNSKSSFENTDINTNISLSGSNEDVVYYYSDENSVIKAPLKHKISKFFKDNKVGSTVITIIIGVFGWLFITVISYGKDIEICKTEIKNLEAKIDNISDNCVNKELYEQRLAKIESEIDKIDIFSIKIMENDIKNLKEQVYKIN